MNDLELLSPVAREEPPPRHGRSVILGVALVALLALICWAVLSLVQGSRAEARTEAALGHSAHAAGDCAAAVPRLKSALSLGRLEFLDPPVDRDALRVEIEACEDLERARHAVGREKYRQAVRDYGDYLDSGAARFPAALDERSDARMTLGRELEERDAGPKALRQYAAVLAEAPDSTPADRAERRVWALFEREVEADRQEHPCAALRPARRWADQKDDALAAVREAAHHSLSWSLYRCGQDRIARGEKAARDARYEATFFDAAREALAQTVERYPDTKPGRRALGELERFSVTVSQAQTTATQVAAKRLETRKIKEQVADALRGADSLRRPDRIGDGSGPGLRLTIRNATGRPLYVAWTGKEPDSVTVPAGGRRCSTARTSTVTIPAGSVAIATNGKGGWAAGKWTFPSDRFRTCIR